MLLTKVKTLSAFICVALSLLVFSNNAVLADDGKLTNEKAKQLISQLFDKQPDKLEVIGVMEPSQNVAQADVVITNLLIARPKNDAVTAYAFGPGGGSYLWSGSGKANFVHYNDGRWVLTRLDTEAGSFSPKLPTPGGQPRPDTAGYLPVEAGSCRVFANKTQAERYKLKWEGQCSDGYADGEGILRSYDPSGRLASIAKGQMFQGNHRNVDRYFRQSTTGDLTHFRSGRSQSDIIGPSDIPAWAHEIVQ